MPKKIKLPKASIVTVDGEDSVEVTLPDSVFLEEDVRANFVAKDVHERLANGVETRVQTAAANATAKARTELMQDDGFLTEATKKRADFFKERFPDAKDVDIEKLRDQFREEEVAPLQDKTTKLEEENGVLKKSTKEGDIERALHAARVTKDSRDLMGDHLRLRAVYSDEYHTTVVVGDDGKVLTRAKEGSMVPVTPADYLAGLRKEGRFKNAFESDQRPGGDFSGEDGPPANQTEQIASLEKAGKLGEAAELKARQLEGMAGSA